MGKTPTHLLNLPLPKVYLAVDFLVDVERPDPVEVLFDCRKKKKKKNPTNERQ
jgi:hypothetical protein